MDTTFGFRGGYERNSNEEVTLIMSRGNKELARTVLCILGTMLLYAGNYAGLLFSLIGLALVLIGSYLWISLKSRHWAFTLFGIAAPLGFIVLAVLKDKTPKPQEAKTQ